MKLNYNLPSKPEKETTDYIVHDSFDCSDGDGDSDHEYLSGIIEVGSRFLVGRYSRSYDELHMYDAYVTYSLKEAREFHQVQHRQFLQQMIETM
jgi:hypothetical protein